MGGGGGNSSIKVRDCVCQQTSFDRQNLLIPRGPRQFIFEDRIKFKSIHTIRYYGFQPLKSTPQYGHFSNLTRDIIQDGLSKDKLTRDIRSPHIRGPQICYPSTVINLVHPHIDFCCHSTFVHNFIEYSYL